MIERKIIKDTGFRLDDSYTRLPHIFFSQQYPSLVPSPELVVLNYPLIKSLELNEKILEGDDGINIFAGNNSPENASNIAQAYAGHQYGHFTMLGDGRAVLIGEHIISTGEKFDIQLKGSGRTPYSRGGDGKAALGPMLREYIISEAMNGLGIPTTRTLSVVKTGESIIREREEIGAVMTRVASSHIRVGTFQYAAKYGEFEDVQLLADYTIDRHFKEIANNEEKYLLFLKEVVKKQAYLIAKWQLVGFIHGVMNTDNMAISGETIDYGPCAFMDVYDPSTVFSSIDYYGRYSYKNQPDIATWNLARFAESILHLLNRDINEAVKIAQKEIMNFENLYKENWLSGMRGKLGIFKEEDDDEKLINELLEIMEKYKADYTNTFRSLTLNELENSDIFKSKEFKEWDDLWEDRLSRQKETKEESKELMKNSNPSVIPRNHRVEEALEAATKRGDYSIMRNLVEVLSRPYSYSEKQVEYTDISRVCNSGYKTYCGT